MKRRKQSAKQQISAAQIRHIVSISFEHAKNAADRREEISGTDSEPCVDLAFMINMSVAEERPWET